jgi:3-oxoacyl-(acyl-carrier-protein) synthase
MTIAISGLGCLSTYGHDLAALCEALSAAAPRSTRIDVPEGLTGASNRALPVHAVADSSWPHWLSPREGRRMSRPSRFAVVAARRALNDACRPVGETIDSSLGVVVSTTFGPTWSDLRVQALSMSPVRLQPRPDPRSAARETF